MESHLLSRLHSGFLLWSNAVIGATAGSFYADLVGADHSTFAAIGFVSLLAEAGR